MTSTEVWERIYVATRPSLCAYATLQLGSGPAAEDVVQDCIAHLIASPHLRIDNPEAYLWASVVNRCRRQGRKVARRARFDPAQLRPWLDESQLGMLEVIGRLSPRRRTAVLLRYYRDLPVIEIAELMGCAPSTMSSLLNRAYKDLKGQLT